jgi:carboxyl-terminal processing protease
MYFRLPAARACAACLTLAGIAATAAEPPRNPVETELKRFIAAYAAIEAQAADPLNSEQAIYGGAIPAMLRRLDPHSVFLDPQQTEQLKQMEKAERKGFGSVVSVLPGRVIVLQTLPGTPSAKAGLSPGDEILVINNVPLNRLDFPQLIQLLTEARQRQASLQVRRPGNARLLQFTLTPELMDSPSVDRAFLLQPGIAYIRITNFDAKTGQLLRDSIEKLGGSSLQGLVLDLRDNPGGVVQSALQAAALFLKPGQEILSVRGRSVQGENVQAPKDGKPYTFPVAVLINGKTASAAEIVTGALQDHDRAVVLGEPSYGKGLVQTVYNLTANSALALTTAFYFTPSGRSIQRPLDGGQLDPAKFAPKGTFHTDSGRAVKGGGGIQPDEVVQPPPMSRLRMVLDASGAFTGFATEYLQKNNKPPANFEIAPQLMDEFQVYLSARNIRPGVGEWVSERQWIEGRLKQEIINLAYGVEKGDEIEMRLDPVVTRAVAKLKGS